MTRELNFLNGILSCLSLQLGKPNSMKSCCVCHAHYEWGFLWSRWLWLM